MPHALTPSQQKALSRERHLALIANAGSGKTQVLVTKYLDILERTPHTSARNVVAITFTENAASELEERISKEIATRLREGDPAQQHRMRQIRDSFSSAVITTIHGFAAKVLKAYPVEASIDASYGILQGPDQKLVVEDCLSRVFYSLLDDAYASDVESETLRTFRALGRKSVTQVVRALLGNRLRASKIQAELLTRDDDQIVDAWYTALKDELSWLAGDDVAETLNALIPFLKSDAKARSAEQSVISFLRTRDAEHAHALCKGLLTQTYEPRKVLVEEIDPAVRLTLDRLAARLKSSAHVIEHFAEGKAAFVAAHTEYLRLMRSLFAIYEDVLADYEQVKSDYAQLDFDDLLLRFARLLEDSRVREELATQYPFVMIDEYQDTDSIQYEIARLLSLNFGSSTRLTIVGDPKQSIYRFRNADVEVFKRTCQAISEQTLSHAALSESQTLELDPEEERGIIALRESFRMARTPLGFINALFRRVMAGSVANEYLDLVQAYPGEGEGTVTLSIAPKPDSESEEEPVEAECNYIAQKLRSMVGNVTVDTKEGRRPAAYGDFAILLRTRTKLTDLEVALRAQNIPFAVLKGTGFFDQQEVLDVISYLRFLVTPSDDVSLVGALRSPFFGVSDQELYQISHATLSSKPAVLPPFWQQVLTYPRPSETLSRAIVEFESLLPLVGRTTSAFLIERIFALSGIIAAVGSGVGGEQKMRNLDKLLQMARDADRSGFSTLFDFIDRLNYLVADGSDEAQADAAETEDAVRIMTVHGAKGLEFPIVFVPFLGSSARKDSGAYLDKELGLRLPYAADNTTGLTALMDLRAHRAANEESERLLYVALTRAKEHLVLTGTEGSKGSNCWLRILKDALPELQDVTETISEVLLATSIERYDSESRSTTIEEHVLKVFRESVEQEFDPGEETLPVIALEALDFQLEHIPIINPVGSYSATQFLTMRECPTKYHLRYSLGLPEDPKLADDLEPHERAERVQDVVRGVSRSAISGTLRGQIVHKLLERVGRFVVGRGIDDERYAEAARSIAHEVQLYDPEESTAIFADAYRHVLCFLRSNLAQFVLDSPRTIPELALQYLLPTGDRIFGILDRAFVLPDDSWSVVDFKTDTLTDRNREVKLSRYRQQLLFYSYLLSKYTGTEKITASLFFTKTNEHFSYIFGAPDFADLEGQFVEMIAIVRENDRAKDLLALEQNVAHCEECAYWNSDAKQCIVNVATGVERHVRQKPTAIPAM
jgi:ATP-dependent helicase/nuclease subunit A